MAIEPVRVLCHSVALSRSAKACSAEPRAFCGDLRLFVQIRSNACNACFPAALCIKVERYLKTYTYKEFGLIRGKAQQTAGTCNVGSPVRQAKLRQHAKTICAEFQAGCRRQSRVESLPKLRWVGSIEPLASPIPSQGGRARGHRVGRRRSGLWRRSAELHDLS
jgi:hypothetical protein